MLCGGKGELKRLDTFIGRGGGVGVWEGRSDCEKSC